MSFAYSPKFVMENTGLASFCESTPSLFYIWLNNDRVMKGMSDFDALPITEKDSKSYSDSHHKDTWIIVSKNNNGWEPIGYTGLFIKRKHRVGIFRIAICADEFLRKGHAKRATLLLIDWAFKECDLYTIHLCVSENNISAINLYEGVGFKKCGTYSNARFEKGSRCNEILMEYTLDMYLISKSNL